MAYTDFYREARKAGYSKEEIENAVAQKTLPPSRLQSFVSSPAIPGAFGAAGGLGGAALGGLGIPVGAAAGYGAGRTVQESLKRITGLEPMEARKFATEEPVKAGAVGLTAATAGKVLPWLARTGTLPFGMRGAGRKIEELTKYTKRDYSWQQLLTEVKERADIQLATTKGKEHYNEMVEIGKKFLDKQGKLTLRGVQAIKQTANEWGTFGNIVGDITKRIEGEIGPAGLARAQKQYATLQTLKKIADVGILGAIRRLIWRAPVPGM